MCKGVERVQEWNMLKDGQARRQGGITQTPLFTFYTTYWCKHDMGTPVIWGPPTPQPHFTSDIRTPSAFWGPRKTWTCSKHRT